jgi:hypothetical protein
MTHLQRPAQNANGPVRTLHFSRTAATAAALAILLACTCPLFAGMTRSTRAHAHPVSQEAEPTPHSKAKHPAPSTQTGKTATHPQVKKPATPPATAHTKSRKHTPAAEPVDDPITLKRATRSHEPLKPHTTPAQLAAKTIAAKTLSTKTIAAKAHAAPPNHAAKPLTHLAQANQPKPAPAAKLAPHTSAASDDFLAAAGARPSAPKDTFAQGVSHPDEMNDELPMPSPDPEPAAPARTPRPAAKAPPTQLSAQFSANPSVNSTDATDVPAAAPTRIAGFGAEGASLTADPHRTMAEHRAELPAELPAELSTALAKAGPLPAAEQAKITDEAVKPMVLPGIYTRGGRLLMPAPLKGSHDILVHQNLMADNEGLERIQDDDALNSLVETHQLARLPETVSLHVNDDLPANRRYARPWTVHFAVDLARAYQQHFGQPLQVNSAVRTVDYQLRLMRTNGNAAAVQGETASPHLTGQAIDLAKRDMSKPELAWMRAYLLPLMQAGKIDVEEEFQQACFHISVYRSYVPALPHKPARTQLAAIKPTPDTDLH